LCNIFCRQRHGRSKSRSDVDVEAPSDAFTHRSLVALAGECCHRPRRPPSSSFVLFLNIININSGEGTTYWSSTEIIAAAQCHAVADSGHFDLFCPPTESVGRIKIVCHTYTFKFINHCLKGILVKYYRVCFVGQCDVKQIIIIFR